jgi:hypothetical protein
MKWQGIKFTDQKEPESYEKRHFLMPPKMNVYVIKNGELKK